VHDLEPEAIAPEDLRAGVRVSAASIGWTVASSATAIAIGIGARSVVLVAFGVVGVLDVVGSMTLVAHFKRGLRHDALSVRHERLALRVVTIGLLVVGAMTAAESTRRLVVRETSHPVPAGVVVAAMSVVILGLLSVGKRRIGDRIPSRALVADGWLSATGCLLAIVTVAGTGLTSAYHLWWADAVAALGVACAAMAVAVVTGRS
jgi:divalent metal cation (Fe/Co/Zn/Cd) transporter